MVTTNTCVLAFTQKEFINGAKNQLFDGYNLSYNIFTIISYPMVNTIAQDVLYPRN